MFYVQLFAIVLATGWITACASRSRLHAAHVPEGALRVVEVLELGLRRDLIKIPVVVETLELYGISREEIRDGTIGAGRVFCCGGPDNSIWFYIPPDLKIEPGDVAVIRAGAYVTAGKRMKAPPNVAVEVRGSLAGPGRTCRWLPEKEGLWMRTLYCDWMIEEGWRQQAGPENVWIKAGDL